MKILQHHRSLIFTLGLPAIALFFTIIWVFPEKIGYLFHWQGLFLLIALVLAFTPLGRTRLQPIHEVTHDKTPKRAKYSFLKWLGSIILLQMSLQVLFIEIVHFITKLLPIFNTAPAIHTQFNTGLVYLGVFSGLFPWGLLALQSVQLGLQAFCLQKDAYFHSIFHFIYPQSSTQTFAIVINTLARSVSIIAISSNLLFLSLWLVWLLSQWLYPFATGFNLATLFVIFSFLGFCLMQKIRDRLTQKLIYFSQHSLPFALLILMLIISAFLLLTQFIFKTFQPIIIKPPIFLSHLQPHDILISYLLFIHAWWLAWLPVISVFLAYFSYGYRIRHVILGILIWPFLSTIALSHWPNLLFWLNLFPPIIHFLVAFCAAAIIITMLSAKYRLPFLILCYLSTQLSTKKRLLSYYLQAILVYTSVLLYLYLPAGLISLPLYYLIPTLPLTLLACLAVISGCLACYRIYQQTRSNHK